MTTTAADPELAPPKAPSRDPHPVARLIGLRALSGVLTLFLVSIVVFLATQILPGNAAYAIVGAEASPEALKAVQDQLHLNRSPIEQYLSWAGGILSGDLGLSLTNRIPVWDFVYPRLINSFVLIVLAGVLGSILALALGIFSALRRSGPFDHSVSLLALVITSIPDYLVAVFMIMVFSTNFLHLLPGTSALAPGSYAWNAPRLIILPTICLTIIMIPYIYRSMRANMLEALESEYVEMARLKGLKGIRVALVHALPNAMAPTIQVVGLMFLYLAGGLVLVEYVFTYPGVGSGLVGAVNSRDVPVIQFIVLVLAAFYVVVNIASDVVALLVTPRRLNVH